MHMFQGCRKLKRSTKAYPACIGCCQHVLGLLQYSTGPAALRWPHTQTAKHMADNITSSWLWLSWLLAQQP
jgi:hypothetical protein